MNILASIHLYPPKHNCGAEYMLHAMLKDLQSRGHSIKVLLHQANQYNINDNYVFEGIDVFPPTPEVIQNLFSWSHCVFTHLDYTHLSIQLGAMYKRPVFSIVHNTYKYPEIENAIKKQYIVYNSEWAKEELNYSHDSFVLTPPVDYRYYDINMDTIDNPYVTLINVNENKGGKIFVDIARAMPNKQFLGVLGSYDKQVTQDLPNLRYVQNSVDIKQWYAQTRILLMPSHYESWGRTATEAMSSGIPVITSEAAGLKENCGKAGIYIKNRNDVKEWVEAIAKLDEEKAYFAASKKAKARSREHDPRKKLDEFNDWFKSKVHEYNNGI
jgi:glycosyltransferase involved in cell wall biosynthesis